MGMAHRIFSSRDRIRSVITFFEILHLSVSPSVFNGKYTEQDKCRDLILAKSSENCLPAFSTVLLTMA